MWVGERVWVWGCCIKAVYQLSSTFDSNTLDRFFFMFLCVALCFECCCVVYKSMFKGNGKRRLIATCNSLCFVVLSFVVFIRIDVLKGDGFITKVDSHLLLSVLCCIEFRCVIYSHVLREGKKKKEG